MAKARKRPVAVFHFRKSLEIADFMSRVALVILALQNQPLLFPAPSPALAGGEWSFE